MSTENDKTVHTSTSSARTGEQASKPVSLNQFSTAALALQTMPPSRVARMVTWSLCLMALLTVLYTSLAHLDVVVSAQGKVIPTGKSKVIQPLEAGTVRLIAVRDGQTVRAGDVLIELDPTSTAADTKRLEREWWETQADGDRLRALMQGAASFKPAGGMPSDVAASQNAVLNYRLQEQGAKLAGLDADLAKRRADTDAIEANISQLQRSLPLIKKKHEMREELAKTGHIAETGLIETQLELVNAEKELAVQRNRLKESQASLVAAQQQRAQSLAEFQARSSVELVEANKKRESAAQELVKARMRRDLQVLRAPIDGVVQALTVTTVGGVVTQAQQLMVIVPENSPLEVEAQVANRDIGHLKVGQRVINKIETFDFTRYGYIEGEVLWVGTDAVVDPKLGPVYPVRIKLAKTVTPESVNGRRGIVTAGMSVTSDIKTEERRMIEYFLAPMIKYKDESLRER